MTTCTKPFNRAEDYELWALRLDSLLARKGLIEYIITQDYNLYYLYYPVKGEPGIYPSEGVKATSVIKLLADSPLLQIRYITKVYELWNEIKDLYGSKGFISEFLLYKELFNTTPSTSGNRIEVYLYTKLPDTDNQLLDYYEFRGDIPKKRSNSGNNPDNPNYEILEIQTEYSPKENPNMENPLMENLPMENPPMENPDTENPKTENPDTENPKTENPNTELPNTDNQLINYYEFRGNRPKKGTNSGNNPDNPNGIIEINTEYSPKENPLNMENPDKETPDSESPSAGSLNSASPNSGSLYTDSEFNSDFNSDISKTVPLDSLSEDKLALHTINSYPSDPLTYE